MRGTQSNAGKVNVLVAMLLDESVTVTGNVRDVVPIGGVPDSTPAVVRVSQDGNPVADHT